MEVPNRKMYLVAIQNLKDGSVRNVQVTESIESTLAELRAYLHGNPNTAFALFPEDWQVIYKEFDLADIGIDIAVSFDTWKKGN